MGNILSSGKIPREKIDVKNESIEDSKSNLRFYLLFYYVIIIIVFASYTVFLSTKYPQKVEYISITQYLGDDSEIEIDFAEISSILNQNGYETVFLDVVHSDDSIDEDLFIHPKSSLDLVIILIKTSNNEVYLEGLITYEVDILLFKDDFLEQEKIITKEMEKIISILNFDVDLNDLEYSDDYAIYQPYFLDTVCFSVFFGVVLILTFVIFYKKGLIIKQIKNGNLKIIIGLSCFSLGILPFWFNLRYLFSSKTDSSGLLCSSIFFVLIIIGLSLIIFRIKRKNDDNKVNKIINGELRKPRKKKKN